MRSAIWGSAAMGKSEPNHGDGGRDGVIRPTTLVPLGFFAVALSSGLGVMLWLNDRLNGLQSQIADVRNQQAVMASLLTDNLTKADHELYMERFVRANPGTNLPISRYHEK